MLLEDAGLEPLVALGTIVTDQLQGLEATERAKEALDELGGDAFFLRSPGSELLKPAALLCELRRKNREELRSVVASIHDKVLQC